MMSIRRFGLGLRMQIVLALSAAFIVSFALLGIAFVQLSERARGAERLAGAETLARVIATAAVRGEGDRQQAVAELADAALSRGRLAGVEITWGELEPWARGLTGLGPMVEVPLPGQEGTVRVWTRATGPEERRPLTDLLLLYVATTGGGILLLAFVALTVLIVRPMEAVTQASERLAQGDMRVAVPVRGAAEVARLAVAFNAMATQLRAERLALERRVQELEQTTHELESARDQLVRSERLASVGRLSAGVAHEIGNPLAAILGLVEILRQDLDDDDLAPSERRELLARVHKETERIRKTIRDLLDFSRQGPDAGDGPFGGMDPSVWADLRGVVDDAMRLLAPQRDLQGVALEVRAPSPESGRVAAVGAPDRLVQVVLNLVLNAADAVDGRGRVRLTLRPGDGEAPAKDVVLEVEDDGPGVDPQVAEHLFEPFVTTKPAGKGTGLGLAVSHTVARRLGGSLTVDRSPELGGARFTLRLPASSQKNDLV